MVKDNSISSKILSLFIHIFLFFILIITLMPILHVIAMSLSSPESIVQGIVTFYPQGIQFDGYLSIFKTGRVLRAFANSLIYMTIGTMVNLIMTIMMAYPLSKKSLPFRSFYSFVVIFTMYFSGGLIPLFILVRNLGIYDSIFAMILPGAISAFNMILMRIFFQGIPKELEESALMDGANQITILIKIILPVAKASIFTIGLFYAVSHWNAYLHPVMFFKTQQKYPLQVILQQIITANEMSQELAELGNAGLDIESLESSMSLVSTAMSEMIKYSTLVFSILPMLLIYPFIQKHFVRGVMLGSLKG